VIQQKLKAPPEVSCNTQGRTPEKAVMNKKEPGARGCSPLKSFKAGIYRKCDLV
jgi:hypothetical protein